jgi:DNA-directed RNA polymerase specialized sigma24 family protein
MATTNLNSLFAEYKANPDARLDPLLEAIRKRALRFLGDEDAVQDFLLEVWPLLADLEIQTSFLAWITVRLRWRNADHHRAMETEADRLQQIPTMYGDDDEEQLTDIEAAEVLMFEQMSKSGGLEPAYFDQTRMDAIEDQTIRQVAEMVLAGATQQEAAAQLGLSTEALWLRLFRYRQRHAVGSQPLKNAA